MHRPSASTWGVQPISASGRSFTVLYGRASMARWALDPALPWVLVDGHTPLRAGDWTEVPVPVGPASIRAPVPHRISHLTMDMLLTTEQFLAAVDEFEVAGSGGLNIWQCDREPRPGLALSQKQFDPDLSRPAFESICASAGVRLAILLPHHNEVASIWGMNSEDVRASWMRGMAADRAGRGNS